MLRAVDEGKPRAQTIELFHISRATIKHYLKQRRETGNVQPHAIPGRTPKKGAALQANVEELLQERSDARLQDYCQMWESRSGVKVSPSTMSRAMRAAGETRKIDSGSQRAESAGSSSLAGPSEAPTAACSKIELSLNASFVALKEDNRNAGTIPVHPVR